MQRMSISLNVLVFVVFGHNGSGDIFDVCPGFLYDDWFEGVGFSSFQRIEGF